MKLLQILFDQLKWLIAPSEMARLSHIEKTLSEADVWISQAHPAAAHVINYLRRAVFLSAVHPSEVRDNIQRCFPGFTQEDMTTLTYLETCMRHADPKSCRKDDFATLRTKVLMNMIANQPFIHERRRSDRRSAAD